MRIDGTRILANQEDSLSQNQKYLGFPGANSATLMASHFDQKESYCAYFSQVSWLTNICFVLLSPNWCFSSAHQSIPYSMFCYIKIEMAKLTARFNETFHTAVTPNRKVVSLGCYIISASKIVKYFPGEHKVVCGFHFLILFCNGNMRERLLFCFKYYFYSVADIMCLLLKARKKYTLEFQRNYGDISRGSEILGTLFLSLVLDHRADLSHAQINFPFMNTFSVILICTCLCILYSSISYICIYTQKFQIIYLQF